MKAKYIVSAFTFFTLAAYSLPLQADQAPQKPGQGQEGQEQVEQEPMQGVVMRVQIDQEGKELGDSAELRVFANQEQMQDKDDIAEIFTQSTPIEEVQSIPGGEQLDSKQRWWNRYRYRGWNRPYYYYYNYYPYYGYSSAYPYYRNYYTYPYGYRYYYWYYW